MTRLLRRILLATAAAALLFAMPNFAQAQWGHPYPTYPSGFSTYYGGFPSYYYGYPTYGYPPMYGYNFQRYAYPSRVYYAPAYGGRRSYGGYCR